MAVEVEVKPGVIVGVIVALLVGVDVAAETVIIASIKGNPEMLIVSQSVPVPLVKLSV